MCEFVFRLPSSHFLFIVDIIIDTQYILYLLYVLLYIMLDCSFLFVAG